MVIFCKIIAMQWYTPLDEKLFECYFFSLLLAQKKEREAEDRKKIQLFKEFLNNIQSEYAMIYLTIIFQNFPKTPGHVKNALLRQP